MAKEWQENAKGPDLNEPLARDPELFLLFEDVREDYLSIRAVINTPDAGVRNVLDKH